MFNLIPKEVRFFDHFEAQSQQIMKAGALLSELVHDFGDARAKAFAIKEVEHQGDLVTQWNYLLAMTVITLVPVTLVFAFLQRFVTQGIASAGVK